MVHKTISRREFVVTGFVGTLAFTMGCSFKDTKPVVSVVKIKNDNIGYAVEQAIDLLCSVPMMKTHVLATVTLGMKNLIGLYPGSVYCSVRSCLHNLAAEKESPGVAFEILDMVKACTPGLVVIDGSTAMEGNGPSAGELVKTNLIIAGTNPLATDMVAAHVMGFHKTEVPTFTYAIQSGMSPSALSEIEIRGERLEDVRQKFKKPDIVAWNDIKNFWGAKEI